MRDEHEYDKKSVGALNIYEFVNVWANLLKSYVMVNVYCWLTRHNWEYKKLLTNNTLVVLYVVGCIAEDYYH